MSLFETTKICLGSTKMEISTAKKSILRWEEIGKSDFASPEKILLLRLCVNPSPAAELIQMCANWHVYRMPGRSYLHHCQLKIVQTVNCFASLVNCLQSFLKTSVCKCNFAKKSLNKFDKYTSAWCILLAYKIVNLR